MHSTITLKHDYKLDDPDVREYNQLADTVAHAYAVEIIDLYEFSKAVGGVETLLDHIHFGEVARSLQGAYIAGYLIAARKAAGLA